MLVLTKVWHKNKMTELKIKVKRSKTPTKNNMVQPVIFKVCENGYWVRNSSRWLIVISRNILKREKFLMKIQKSWTIVAAEI